MLREHGRNAIWVASDLLDGFTVHQVRQVRHRCTSPAIEE